MLKENEMVKLILILFIIFFNVSFCSIDSDSTNNDRSGNSNYYYFNVFKKWTVDDYYHLLDSLKEYGTTDFFKLRITFTKTNDYEPYDSEFEDPFNPVYDFINSQKYTEAINILDSLLKKCYVNIKGHLYCGYVYKLMGDSLNSEYHYNIYNGLIESILNYGDGSVPERAFIVIFVEEEYLLLDAVNMSMGTQGLTTIDGHSFDVLTVYDKNTNEERELFFNINLLSKE
jgi:hypothetical protein